MVFSNSEFQIYNSKMEIMRPVRMEGGSSGCHKPGLHANNNILSTGAPCGSLPSAQQDAGKYAFSRMS